VGACLGPTPIGVGCVRASLGDLCPLAQRPDLARMRDLEGGDITSVITGVIPDAVAGPWFPPYRFCQGDSYPRCPVVALVTSLVTLDGEALGGRGADPACTPLRRPEA
jgi:hypothetical protein